MLPFLEVLSILCAGLFAGAALYVTVVEHPARMECGSLLAATEFGPSYRRGAAMQAPLAAVGSIASIAVGCSGGSGLWVIAGFTLMAVIPLTLLVIARTNKKLLDPTLDRTSEVARTFLVRWGQLHAIRTVLSLASFLLMMVLMAH
jgi:anthrone oxygenase-like protein